MTTGAGQPEFTRFRCLARPPTDFPTQNIFMYTLSTLSNVGLVEIQSTVVYAFLLEPV